MLRSTPPGEDDTNGVKANPVSALADGGGAPGEDTTTGQGPRRDIYTEAQQTGLPEGDTRTQHTEIKFLQLVREAEDQALLYTNQSNRRAWSDGLKAMHNEHFSGSKYNRPDWRQRSKIFVPKTRNAVRKDMSAVAASLFNSMDAINCTPGNESDPKQRAAASVVQELVNYRTDRASGRAALPWFEVSMGARYDADVTGICLTKQFWKLELKKRWVDGPPDEYGQPQKIQKWSPDIDRPDIHLFAPENFIIDPAADWTDPVQSAAFLILKYPMRIDEIRRKQESPVSPWRPISEDILRTSLESSKYDMAAIRRARESGLDRLDETQTGYEFQVIWVYEVFIRTRGEDWTFWSVGNRDYLTDPRPVEEVYPEQFGERPVTMGYGSLEPHRIFPMAPVDSWRQTQLEINDLHNLSLDAIKQNVMPITKIVRGRQIDLDQVKRRSSGSAIIVSHQDDVTWEQPPQIGGAAAEMIRDLELSFDDSAGQFNGGTTENNNALARTLGGLKLVAGSANAVQEFDIRVWIMTWAERALAQLVRLEQYYESDPIVLGLCGDRAQLFQKFGIDKIDNDLLEQEVTIRVSIGLGAGDPQARLAKFQTATSIVAPLLASSPDFTSGKKQMDTDAVIAEVYGAAGYRDGGKRFFKEGQPAPNPLGDLPAEKLRSEIAKNQATAKASQLTALAAVAKVQLGDRELEAANANQLLEHYKDVTDMAHRHADMRHRNVLAAKEHGHSHGMEITKHRHEVRTGALDRATQAADKFHERATTAADKFHDRASAAATDVQDRVGAAEQQKWERDHADRKLDQEAQAIQQQGTDGGDGGDGGAAQQSVSAPQPQAPPQPQGGGTEDLRAEIDGLNSKMDQLIKLVAASMQPKPGFPSNPYPNQGAR
jgi:hypothetical protein